MSQAPPIETWPLFAGLNRIQLTPPAAMPTATSTLGPTTAWPVFAKALSPAEAGAR